MLNLWLIAASVLVAAGAAALAVRTRSFESSSSLAPRDTAVPPVSSEWLSNERGKGEQS